MWFRKTKDKSKSASSLGEARALDGHRAMHSIERAAGDVLVVHSAAGLSEITGPLSRLTTEGPSPETHMREASTLRDVLATATGHALSGLRTSAVVMGLAGVHESLRAAAGKRLPFIVHLTCGGQTRATGALHGSHGDYYAAGDTGFFQLFAKDAQEVADFALIARRVAERSLTPGICAQDLYATSHSVQNLSMPDPDLVARYLGRSDDSIPSPSEAQTILFGETRRRIPIWLDPDRPAGIGGVQDRESYYKGIAARRIFFADEVPSIIDEAMAEYGELTGRHYETLPVYRVDDADVVVLAQGALIEELRTVVDFLRETEKIKAGLINLSVYRPFPGARLTRLLEGKKGVTVLERTDAALAEDLPMMREVRSAIDKATENGMASQSSRETPPHSAYAVYRDSGKRPRLFSGVYGVGRELPSFSELVDVYRNMLPTGVGKTRFYVGAGFDQDTRRFPQLQMLQQRLTQTYPGLGDLSLDAGNGVRRRDENGHAIQLHSLAAQGALFAGNLLAETFADALGWDVRTFPEGGLDPNLQPSTITISYAAQNGRAGGQPAEADTILVTDVRLLERLPSRRDIKRKATLIVGSAHDAETFWRQISNRTARWIQDNELRLYIIDAALIASDTASHSAFVDQLMVWSLLGGWLRSAKDVVGEDEDSAIQHLGSKLHMVFGEEDDRVKDIIDAAKQGSLDIAECNWQAWGSERPVRPEAEPPWTVRDAGGGDETVFDPKRFWHSVGYLYDRGEADRTLTDPYVATGILPARSSAFRDVTPFRLRTPRWLPENCTACGLCWALCPESALPPSLHDLSSIIETAMSEHDGVVVQLGRISGPLAKQAHQLIAKNGVHPYVTVGPLLRDAFSKLVAKMNLEGDQLDALKLEFDPVCRIVESYAIAKTDCFFDEPDKREKGSGRLFSIALNPSSCTGCGVCVEECPDAALEWSELEDGELETLRKNAELQRTLPTVSRESIESFVSDADPTTQVRRLLDPSSYWSLVGGDGSFPGNAAKTAVHLVTATVESVMRARFDAHVDKLSQLIERIKTTIQGDVETVTKINDFEEFGRRLSRLDREGLTPESLTELVGVDSGHVSAVRLKRLSDLLGALEEQRRRYREGADGTGRARMVMTIDSENGTLWSGTYPYNPHPHPWVHHLPGDAATLAAGIIEGMTTRFAQEFAVYRRAELELSGGSEANEATEALDDEARGLIPPAIVLGSTHITGWDDVSRLVSTGLPVKVVMINADGPAVLGRGGVDDIGMKALTRDDVFVLQASVGHPGHLIQGIAEGMASRRPAVFHIHAPNPQANGIAPDRVADQARLAYKSRTFPLFSFDPDSDDPRLNLKENPDHDHPWSEHELVATERSGEQFKLTVPLTIANWAVGEARFRRFFKIVSKGHLNEQMKPLAGYIDLTPEERETFTPFIHVVDDEGRHMLAIVSREIVEATEQTAAHWKRLCQTTSPRVQPDVSVDDAQVPDTAAPATTQTGQASIEGKVYEQVTERLLEMTGYGRDSEFFKRSLRDFLTREEESAGEEEVGTE